MITSSAILLNLIPPPAKDLVEFAFFISVGIGLDKLHLF